ncbi:hypothetical protein ACI2L4_33745 [Streptomyces sparsogenes]|uniref:hypothetical protein n=1 Tax=Streptomyces sparsogenes TaxID=67365 RepID=UPI0033F1346B
MQEKTRALMPSSTAMGGLDTFEGDAVAYAALAKPFAAGERGRVLWTSFPLGRETYADGPTGCPMCFIARAGRMVE